MRSPTLPVRRRAGLRLAAALAGLLALSAGCASKADGPPVVRTKIDYDSTRDGPRPRPEAEGEASEARGDGKQAPAACDHAWEALSRATHAYPDPADPLGAGVAICTPVVCTKCGLVRHECRKRRSR